MRGHEFVREAVRTYLEQAVPARLAAYLAGNGVSSPDPASVQFLLADVLEGVTDFPVVLVKSTNARSVKWVKRRTWWYAYDLELIAACDHRVHGTYEGASMDRDRLLLAVREAVLVMAGLPDGIDLQPGEWPEETGAAVQTLAGVPLAAGTVRFTVRLAETVADLAPVESFGAVNVAVSAVPADAAIP